MNHEDPIIDPLLEELLGGKIPPDLTARVLTRLSERELTTPSRNGTVHNTAHFAVPQDNVAAAQGDPTSDSRVMVAKRRVRRARRWQTYASFAISLSLLGVLAGAGWLLWRAGDWHDGSLAQGDRYGDTVAQDDDKQGQIEKHGGRDVIDSSRAANETLTSPRDNLMPAATGADSPRRDDQKTDIQPSPDAAPRHVAPIERPSLAKSDAEIVERVNRVIAEGWKAENIQPAQPATESEWCRRTYLQLLGRIPTVDEVQKFASRRGKDKREWLVDQLIQSETYREEFASYWSARWANILVGQAGGMSADSPIDRKSLEGYLNEAFAQNRPYDSVVRELLTASGSNRPEAEDFNPATNFLVATLDQDAKLATAKACQTFLGQRLQCVECHTHPTNGWQQDTFWSMNAFFRQIKTEKVASGSDSSSDKPAPIRIVNRDFHGSAGPGSGNGADEAEVYFEQQNGILKVAYPRFVDGTEIPRSGKLDQVDRRQELAQLVINSDLLPKATVNRMWQHFLGVGFTTPVDDMGPHNPPSHPELLATLADDFAASGFDMRRLMRWITLSDAYGLSSKITDGNLADDPGQGQPLFARYYSRQMEAEQLFHSLTMLAQAKPTGGGIIASGDDRHQWLGQVTQKMGNDEDTETSALDGTVSQSLLMMNGHLMNKATDLQSGVLKGVIASKMSPQEKVEHLFLASLSRKPNKREMKAIDEIIQSRQHEINKALQDIWWALLNSNEFIVDH